MISEGRDSQQVTRLGGIRSHHANFGPGYDPVWVDLLQKHNEEPFHVLVGGGDQLYCDGLTREPELQGMLPL